MRTSEAVVALGHMGEVYLYQQNYGYILKMSPDVFELWAAFRGSAERSFVEHDFRSRLDAGGQSPADLIDIFSEFDCLESTTADPAEAIDKLDDFVPVKGAWNVWRRHLDDDGDRLALWTAWGDRDLATHRLSATETRIWDDIDGEKRVRELGAIHSLSEVRALTRKLVGVEIQALKMSLMPLSVFGGKHRWPAYLTSTMPYPPLKDGVVPAIPKLADYHEKIDDASTQFDHHETTLAHLLRKPHPALSGRTFAVALLEGLEKRGLSLGERPLRVLEVGGGLGEVAVSTINAAAARGFELDYKIIELSPTLAEHQRKRTGGRAEIIVANALSVELLADCADLIIANEMIGDLPVTPLAEASAIVEKYKLDVEGPPAEDALIGSGAIELLERIARWLAPGGLAIVTEFGEKNGWPRVSTHLDHPEVSIHFGHLEQAATAIGLEPRFEYLMDILELRRDLKGLATTRSQFRALSGMLESAGVAFEKIGYTEVMFNELVSAADDLSIDDLGDLRFDKIEDRLMGIVPHEFKALTLSRPAKE